MFKYVKRFLKALNANAHPGDIAHAVSLGLLLALVPKGNLLWPFLFILTMFIRMNKGALFISLILLSFVIPFIDVWVEKTGFILLTQPTLHDVYALLYATPFIGLTRFNNTMVMGSLIWAMVLYVPIYFLSRVLVQGYRTHVQPKIVNSKIYKLFFQLPLVRKIVGAVGIGGE